MMTDANQTEIEGQRVEAGALPPWEVAELPEPPRFAFAPLRIIGPGMLMAGGAIGGGEWLIGPALTATYGGALMWIATLSILFQSAYNLEVMRYALYCGEPIFVGFFRTLPGPRFWTVMYLLLDFGAIWPYLAANAAVPFVAAFLGHIPADTGVENLYVRWSAYGIFLAAFLPLVFGGKIYNALEKVMVAKIVLVLGYLLFIGVFYVEPETWREVFAGFLNFGGLPEVNGQQVTWSEVFGAYWRGEQGPIDLALLATFAAIAGTGGLTNSSFSSYAREKGWGMGKQVGAIRSIFGGKGVSLAHTGKVFPITEESKRRWRGWRNMTMRDQFGIWVVGCILGVGIPALISLQFVRGQTVNQNNVAAMTAQGLRDATGVGALWFLTLLCGFLVLAPSQVSTVDGLVRRWTDVLWTGNRRLRHLDGEKVAYVYYGMLMAYALWGLFVLTMFPKPLAMVKMSGVLMNFALGFSALHTLAVNCLLLPPPLRPHWFMRLSMVCCAIFFIGISVIGLPTALAGMGWTGK